MKRVQRLIGVYDADGGLAGELRYLLDKRRGRAHCGLCDVTHGPVRKKRSFLQCTTRLAVPFELVHRNERPPGVRPGCEPCVLADVDGELIELLDANEIEAAAGDVDEFERRLRDAARRMHLVL